MACVDCVRGVDARDLVVVCEFCRGTLCPTCQVRPYHREWRRFWACHGCVTRALNAHWDRTRAHHHLHLHAWAKK